MKNALHLSAATAALLLLGACSAGQESPQTAGERISQRGTDIGNYGEAWTKGEHDVDQGTKSVEKSQKMLAEAERDLVRARQDVARAEEQIRVARTDRADAEAMIARGHNRMEGAEEDYSDIREGPAAISPGS